MIYLKKHDMDAKQERQKIEKAITRGVEKIYPSKQVFKKVLLSGKKLRIYQGFDPSMPSLHLGNLVGILKLKEFQELGHEIIFLVGDFTGMIGDPTDKSKARPKLTREEVLENAKNWKGQISRFLNFSGRNPAKILFNSEWLDRVNFRDLIEITSNFTVQRIIERDFFQKRIKQGKPIFLHEFLYPIAQALDSVEMNVDLEVGGNDQTFNMLVGRDLMRMMKQKEKFVLTTKLLVDKNNRKIGKTTGNAIFLDEKAKDMYGKVMRFPDEVIVPGFELLTLIQPKEQNKNPMLLKQALAFEIIKLNYGKESAKKAQREFEDVFQRKGIPSEIKKIKLKKKSWPLCDLLLEIKLAPSKTEARRLVMQKAVKIDGIVHDNWKEVVDIERGMVIKVGKRRFIKVG